MIQPRKSISKKMCLIGASGVGKTSLVKRFVEGKFDEFYRTTLGGRMYKKSVICDEEQVLLTIWDSEGKDTPGLEGSATDFAGAQGYMLVADVTRPRTLDVVKDLLPDDSKKEKPPFVILINKQDILHSPAMTNRAIEMVDDGTKVFETSAKIGEGVNEAFECLAKQMLDEDDNATPIILKDDEESTFGSSSGSIEASTLSLEERALFDDLFRALDSLVLERSPEGHVFRPIHTVPEWAHYLITTDPNEPSQSLYTIKSPDLKDYLAGAMPWWDQHEGGASESKSWEEDGPSEDGLDLEAAAIAIGPRKLLVIKRGAPSRRAYIQLMREKRLSLHPLLSKP